MIIIIKLFKKSLFELTLLWLTHKQQQHLGIHGTFFAFQLHSIEIPENF